MAGSYSDVLFQANPPSGWSAQELNKLGGFVGTPGVTFANDLLPSGSGTTMTFGIGRCIIKGTDDANQGYYLCTNTASQNYTLPGGVASSSHERIDYLIAKVYDDPIAVVSGGTDEWKIVAVTGTEAAVGSAVAPSLSGITSYIPIATAKVNSSGIVSVTDQRQLSNHPSVLDSTGAIRFIDKTTSGEVITAPKKFTGGLQRGASGRVRGYNHLVALRTSTYTLPNINIATDNFTPLVFNSVTATAIDDGLAYNSSTGIITVDGGYAVFGMASVKCPSGYGGVRIVTGTGVVLYQLVLASSNSPFDFLSLPFYYSGDYSGTLTVQVGQQSNAAQTQPANDNGNNPVRLEIVGLC